MTEMHSAGRAYDELVNTQPSVERGSPHIWFVTAMLRDAEGKRVGFEDHAMTTPRPEEGGSGKGTPGDSRRLACRHLPVFEKLGEGHMLPIIFATKESISYTWKRRGSWGPASPTHAVGGCTGHAGRQTSQTEVAHAGANQRTF